MPTYEVAPNFVPADNKFEADDAAEAIEAAMDGAVELMRDPSNWTATEVADDAADA